MLTEIRCDKFRAAHQKIHFNIGLNTVLGSKGGNNAIGKSTLLLIIDFCFGGDSYIKLSSDVFKSSHVGHHRIDFTFCFERNYYFSRFTNNEKYVSQYNANYKSEIKKLTITEFRSWLSEQYNLEMLPQGVRIKAICEHFFRVSGCNNSNPNEPLRVSTLKSWEQTDFLMALLDKYKTLSDVKSAAEEFGIDASKLLNTGTDKNFSGQLEQIEQERNMLLLRLEREQRKYEDAQLSLLGFDNETDDKIRALLLELKQCGSRRSVLRSQYIAIQNNLNRSGSDIVRDFSPLLRYFPNANVIELAEVEDFHQAIGSVLSEGIKNEIARLKPQIAYYDRELARLKAALAETNVAKKNLEQSLAECVNIKVKINELNAKEKKIHDEREQQHQRIEAQKKLSKLLSAQTIVLEEAEELVTEEMKRINSEITLETELPPRLCLSAKKDFDFHTIDNRSDGTACKSLVIFDLAMLTLTPVPAIIHDSNTLVHIEIPYLEKIIEFYNGTIARLNKQVFIAFDKAENYSPETQKLIAETARVHLSDTDVLFNIPPWSKQTKILKETL